jgi:hypothetical protein
MLQQRGGLRSIRSPELASLHGRPSATVPRPQEALLRLLPLSYRNQLEAARARGPLLDK